METCNKCSKKTDELYRSKKYWDIPLKCYDCLQAEFPEMTALEYDIIENLNKGVPLTSIYNTNKCDGCNERRTKQNDFALYHMDKAGEELKHKCYCECCRDNHIDENYELIS